MSEYAFNLIPLRDGARLDDFKVFSREIDRPTLIAQDVVEGFDAYVVTRREEALPSVHIVELMEVRSWDDWVDVRDNAEAIKPVSDRFVELVDPDTVRTIFCTKIEAR